MAGGLSFDIDSPLKKGIAEWFGAEIPSLRKTIHIVEEVYGGQPKP